MSIVAENLGWRIGSKRVLEGVSLAVEPGKTLGLLGPNGSGKTTLLRLLAGLRSPHSGRVLLDGNEIGALNRRKVASRVAFVEQHASTNANIPVIEVVKLGRFPHRSLFSGWTLADQEAVENALERVGIADKRDRNWQSLSGGERQRVHIARALAQAPSELILDEPTNHLDIEHQIALMRLVAGLPLTSVIALHDLNHAAMFCDSLIVLDSGRIVAAGRPREELTEELLLSVFRVETRIEFDSDQDRPRIRYLR
ncbi:ABC transporter ATP-binding protein [Pelagibacterium limicola]|uniref:ABC transporter ATP-binding protein n=1 Tax=Pelagibacterium limicola TaxID=2791022 RepID=UPI0018AFA6DA|nr:ABC transporter ATP-binding protein [Pelagibacterium limicola]